MIYNIVLCNRFVMPCRQETFYEWIGRFNSVYTLRIIYENHSLNYYSEFKGFRQLIGSIKEKTQK